MNEKQIYIIKRSCRNCENGYSAEWNIGIVPKCHIGLNRLSKYNEDDTCIDVGKKCRADKLGKKCEISMKVDYSTIENFLNNGFRIARISKILGCSRQEVFEAIREHSRKEASQMHGTGENGVIFKISQDGEVWISDYIYSTSWEMEKQIDPIIREIAPKVAAYFGRLLREKMIKGR